MSSICPQVPIVHTYPEPAAEYNGMHPRASFLETYRHFNNIFSSTLDLKDYLFLPGFQPKIIFIIHLYIIKNPTYVKQ
jgi:hypothetical protein